jgi:C-terminal processing protease CtpA/Prc
MISKVVLVLVLLLGGVGCNSIVPRDLPDSSPPLADMEMSLTDAEEPKDEEVRAALPAGSFTGILPAEPRRRRGQEAEVGLTVREVIENSPADAAGIVEDDILLAVRGADEAEEEELCWPSQWRKRELETPPGEEIIVIFDRAGLEAEVRIRPIPRVRKPGRVESARYREDGRIGVVVRTATEVEARSAGRGPGGGAVVIGLSRRSPWRRAGIRYGDLVTAVNGKAVDHPQVVLDAVREGEDEDEMTVEFVRNGEANTVQTALSDREREVSRVTIPVLFDYEQGRGDTEWSVLLGLLGYESTPAAYEWTLLWLIHFGGGDADQLKEVDTP